MSIFCNPKIHHRKSIRLKEYDYSSPGSYFVTICTKNRKHYFGEIINRKMILNETGKIIKNCWQDIPKHFDNVNLDFFVIMPNHLHGIIIRDAADVSRRGVACNAPTNAMSMISPNVGELSTIIRSFKSAASRFIHKNRFYDFAWQRNYYEHIIRNEFDLHRIREYITNNSTNWESDRNNV